MSISWRVDIDFEGMFHFWKVFKMTRSTKLIFYRTDIATFVALLLQWAISVFRHTSSTFLHKVFLNHDPDTNFFRSKSDILAIFCWKFLLQMAVEWREITLGTCSRYEKHSPDSGLYVGKKIRVIRRVEMKISKET